jgi:uncharacterized membrane protein
MAISTRAPGVPLSVAPPHRDGADRRRRVRPAWLALAGCTLVGLIIRLLLVRGVWVDEAITIHQVHMPLAGMLHNLRQTDNHPPLSYLILWLTVRAAGYGELAVHLPTIVEGTLLIPLLYLTGRELFGPRTALTAAAIGALAPLAVWYSQEARDYELFMLLATLALWAQVRAVRDGRTRYWITYAAATVGLIYTHYFSIFPIAVQQLAFAAVVWHRARAGEPVRRLLISIWAVWLVVAIALLPLAPFAVTQIRHDQATGTGFSDGPAAVGQQPGPGLSVYAVLSNLVYAIWGYQPDTTMLRIAALWPLLMLLGLALLGRRRSNPAVLVLGLVFVPIASLLVLSLGRSQLFDVRYFVGTVPMLILLIARTVSTFSERRLPVAIATAALLATLAAGLADEQLNPSNPRIYDFRGEIAKIRTRVRPGDVVLYAPNYLQAVLQYYRPGVPAEALVGPHPRAPRGHAGVFLLGSFTNDPGTAAQLGAEEYELRHSGRRLVASFAHEQVEVLEYR